MMEFQLTPSSVSCASSLNRRLFMPLQIITVISKRRVRHPHERIGSSADNCQQGSANLMGTKLIVSSYVTHPGA